MTKVQHAPVAKVYFENLNTIRFIAALLVVIHHTEQFKEILHIPNHWNNKFVFVIGKLGVILFFTLSGFLISYLLFIEQKFTNTIGIRNFYIRRMLRIWPLYFLVVMLAFFILPLLPIFTLPDYPKNVVLSNLFYKLFLYITFLPNLAVIVFGIVPYISQAWSIGAEEQFYLIWPYLNRRVRNKWLLMASVIIAYLIMRFVAANILPIGTTRRIVGELLLSTPIDCMAIGGLFALIVYDKSLLVSRIRQAIFQPTVQWIVLIITLLLIANGFYFPYIHYEIYATLFGIIIVNFSANSNRIFSLEYSWINYLGKISYGLYMFHPITIVLSINILQKMSSNSNILLYPLSIGLLVILATVSYEFFERYFIRKKVNYAKVLSGDEARDFAAPGT